MNRPSISVVSICYNAAEELERTIDSVKEQNYPEIEYIIIDGNSSDGTLDVIRNHTDVITNWSSEPDKGIYDAMNKGIDKATGDWIIFMNAGDMFNEENVISRVFENKTYPDKIGLIYGDTIIVNYIDGRTRFYKSVPFYESKEFLPDVGICHQSIFTRTSLAKKYHFDLQYKICSDYNMVYEIYKAGYQFYNVDFVVSRFASGGFANLNTDKARIEKAKILNNYKTVGYYVDGMKITFKNFRHFIAINTVFNWFPSFYKRHKETTGYTDF